ncbi:MAG TPA: 3-deoxy-manno-octulosonate cytidylyltransferase [Phycisphaerae bacterium]|nr:3-deoxy-manno-octulosonate cytidylyltransferase [Phycisphaerae bacterium]
MNAIAIIPARYASTRFPGKPLLRDTGKYLIQHVCEQVGRARSIAEVIVATDDERIAEAVQSFGGRIAMTRADHPSGTDRVAEVARGLDAEIIVNVQGDEPEIEPGNIDKLVGLLVDDPTVRIGTLACPFPPGADPTDPNAVKVVLDARGRALYFSRSLIPYPRDTAGRPTTPGQWLLHLGIYAYRRPFLLDLAKLPPTPLEQREKLEQLRVLENGYTMAVGTVDKAAIGIDTPEDYAAFVARCRAGAGR